MKRRSLRKSVVVKVGGSLLLWPDFPERLRAYLDEFDDGHMILVVGGGLAADFVRELDSLHHLGDNLCHGLALRALDLTAHVVASMIPGLRVITRPEQIAESHERGLIPVFAPRWYVENIDRTGPSPLKASWEVTTDSIAASLSVHLGSEKLVLLKSTGALGSASAIDAARAGLVDPCFPEVSVPIARIEFVNLRANPPTVETL